MKQPLVRRYMLFAVFLSFSLFAFPQSNVPSKPLTAAEQSLTSAEKDFITAARKGDSAFFKRALTDDFSYVGTDGQLAQRQDRIDEFSEAGTDFQPYYMKVVMADDAVGIVTYDAVVRVPPSEDQGPPPRYQHISTVWVKQGGEWKMKFQQMTASHWGDW